MTAPELVEVVQAALAAHQSLTLALYPDYYCCTCGERSIEQPSAHQARAVLAALTEAGTVEWGVRWPGDDEPDEIGLDRDYIADECMPHILMPGEAPPELVSRLVFPWTAAE